MAKKKNGKPKEDYPPFEMSQTIKEVRVKMNRFCLVYSDEAVINNFQGSAPLAPAPTAAVVVKSADVNELKVIEKDDDNTATTGANSPVAVADPYKGRSIMAPSPRG